MSELMLGESEVVSKGEASEAWYYILRQRIKESSYSVHTVFHSKVTGNFYCVGCGIRTSKGGSCSHISTVQKYIQDITQQSTERIILS